MIRRDEKYSLNAISKSKRQLKGESMRLILSALCFMLISGCSRNEEYQLSSSEPGRIYRLNKNTGDISLIEGYNIVHLQEPRSIEAGKPTEIRLSQAKSWPSFTSRTKLNITMKLKTTWREGRLFYILTASPYTDQLKESRESNLSDSEFILELMDSSGFNLLEIPIKIKSMAGTVDNDNKVIQVTANDHVTCTSDTYLALTSWSCEWSF